MKICNINWKRKRVFWLSLADQTEGEVKYRTAVMTLKASEASGAVEH